MYILLKIFNIKFMRYIYQLITKYKNVIYDILYYLFNRIFIYTNTEKYKLLK